MTSPGSWHDVVILRTGRGRMDDPAFPRRCAHCGARPKDLVEVAIEAGAIPGWRAMIPYCPRHARALRIVRASNGIGIGVGLGVGFLLFLALLSLKVDAKLHVGGFDLEFPFLGFVAGAGLGFAVRSQVVRRLVPPDDLAVIAKGLESVHVGDVADEGYIVRFRSEGYAKSFRDLNAELVE